jgi:hypothetical protein
VGPHSSAGQVTTMTANHPSKTPRATRLRMDAPVLYRSASRRGWATGETLDISRSGMLFVPAATDDCDAILDLVVLLSTTSPAAGTSMSDLCCGGPVVRRTSTPDGRQAWAIRFDYDWSGAPASDEGSTTH